MSERIPPSRRQAELLEAIRRRQTATGYSPTIREICSELGVTNNDVMQKLVYLRAKGWVEWQPNLARTIKLLGEAEHG